MTNFDGFLFSLKRVRSVIDMSAFQHCFHRSRIHINESFRKILNNANCDGGWSCISETMHQELIFFWFFFRAVGVKKSVINSVLWIQVDLEEHPTHISYKNVLKSPKSSQSVSDITDFAGSSKHWPIQRSAFVFGSAIGNNSNFGCFSGHVWNSKDWKIPGNQRSLFLWWNFSGMSHWNPLINSGLELCVCCWISYQCRGHQISMPLNGKFPIIFQRRFPLLPKAADLIMAIFESFHGPFNQVLSILVVLTHGFFLVIGNSFDLHLFFKQIIEISIENLSSSRKIRNFFLFNWILIRDFRGIRIRAAWSLNNGIRPKFIEEIYRIFAFRGQEIWIIDFQRIFEEFGLRIFYRMTEENSWFFDSWLIASSTVDVGIWDETVNFIVSHLSHSFELFGIEIRISSKLIWRGCSEYNPA